MDEYRLTQPTKPSVPEWCICKPEPVYNLYYNKWLHHAECVQTYLQKLGYWKGVVEELSPTDSNIK